MNRMLSCLIIISWLVAIAGCAGSGSTSSSSTTSHSASSPISIPYKYHDHILNRIPQPISYELKNDSMIVVYSDSIKITILPDNSRSVTTWDSITTLSGSKSKSPSIIESRQPRFPDIAIRAGLEAKVIVKAWINDYGNPKKVIVMQSGAELFNDLVTDAVKEWKFAPLRINGETVGLWAIMEFDFVFKNSRPKVIMPY